MYFITLLFVLNPGKGIVSYLIIYPSTLFC